MDACTPNTPSGCGSGSDAAERPKPIRHQRAPVTSESAPTMTCAVATSAALFVQIVAAPSATCTKIKASQKMASFASESLAAEPFPRQPCRHRHACQDQNGDEAMDHLQNNLKGGNGIFAVDFHAVRIVTGDGSRRWCPARFFHRRRENQESPDPRADDASSRR